MHDVQNHRNVAFISGWKKLVVVNRVLSEARKRPKFDAPTGLFIEELIKTTGVMM